MTEARMSTELVGPVPTIQFWDGTKVAYRAPRDTMDNRYAACRDHHPACDCREAENSEGMNEFRTTLADYREAFETILRGHAVNGFGERPECQCHGCQIARAAHVFVGTQAMTEAGRE